MSDNPKSPLSLRQSLDQTNNQNLIQQIKSVGNQPRPSSTSPNTIADTNARALSTPAHVTNVRATLSRTSDVSSKVTVSFKRDPSDYFFSSAVVYVSGYKGNPAPVQVASGQSPISFALENTGEPVSVTVQAVGNLGPAPLATAPNATIKLDKTNLVTVATTSGNGTGGGGGSSGINPSQTPRTGDVLEYNEYGAGGWDPTGGIQRFVACMADNGGGNAAAAPGIVGCQSATLASTFGTPTLANIPATATEGYSLQLTSSATAATTLNNGVAVMQGNVGQGHWPFSTFRRFKSRVCFKTTTNVRWWIGLFEGCQTTGASGLATDTPNFSYAGFRFSAGVDSKIVAICGTATASQTVVNTGIAIDTVNSQLFEIAHDATNYYFYINGTLVATISSTLPSNTSVCAMAVVGDNKNTANSNVLLFQSMILTMR